jgi:hypothetical protein
MGGLGGGTGAWAPASYHRWFFDRRSVPELGSSWVRAGFELGSSWAPGSPLFVVRSRGS